MLKRVDPPLYPEFPKKEFDWRAKRARKVMSENNLDALMLTENVNVLYATGMLSVSVGRGGWTPPSVQPTVIITQDELVFVQEQNWVRTRNNKIALETTWVDNFEIVKDEVEIADVMRRYGIRRGYRIGTEFGPGTRNGIIRPRLSILVARVWNELSAQIVDGSASIWKTRMVKSRLEQDRMRKSVRAAAIALDRALDIVEPRMNQYELARKAGIFMYDGGATMVTNTQVYEPGWGGSMQKDKKIQKGNYIGIDASCEYRFYTSDLYRCALLGRRPTEGERLLYECRKGANEILETTIKPGVPAGEIIDELKEFVEEYRCILPQPVGGHGIGIQVHEPPGLKAGSLQPDFANEDGKFILEEGMMFTLEMDIRHPDAFNGRAYFNIEDDVLVTPTGCEVMSDMLSRDLRIK
jgi:Xaa-Pro aminopeptidase